MRTQDDRAITVVVADDEPHVVDYLDTVLTLAGIAVVGKAFDADDAVEVVLRERPGVALLDLRMPGGGLRAARLIGLLNPETRIVIFSSAADGDDLLGLLDAGIDGYVVKGCSAERLIDAITGAVAAEQPQHDVNRFAANQLADRLDADEREALHAMRVRERMSSALAPGGCVTQFQPIRDVARGVIHSVEAVPHFTQTPDHSPAHWLSDADSSGLRVALELSLAKAAIQQIDRLNPSVALSLNVSRATLLSGRLHEVLPLACGPRVILEVTEKAEVEDAPALVDALAQWRRAGAGVAVDNAGAGYASHAHIRNLAPDYIKIGRDLTHDIAVDRERQALTRALVAYAAQMQVRVIAEGIDTQPQMEMIRELGVPLAQGDHIGRPRPLDEQPELLRGAGDETPPPVLDVRDPSPETIDLAYEPTDH